MAKYFTMVGRFGHKALYRDHGWWGERIAGEKPWAGGRVDAELIHIRHHISGLRRRLSQLMDAALAGQPS